jgi:hypothetical protein
MFLEVSVDRLAGKMIRASLHGMRKCGFGTRVRPIPVAGSGGSRYGHQSGRQGCHGGACGRMGFYDGFHAGYWVSASGIHNAYPIRLWG